MQDADLLVQLAGIAGVFVGFGALISVRSGGEGDAHEISYVLASRPSPFLMVLAAGSTIWLPTASLLMALALAALGLVPDQEPALYLTAVGLGLYMGAIGLFAMVFSVGRPWTSAQRR